MVLYGKEYNGIITGTESAPFEQNTDTANTVVRNNYI